MAKLTHFALLVSRSRPKRREITQLKLQNGKRLQTDDYDHSPDSITKLVTLHKGAHAYSWLRDQALNLQSDLLLSDTNTLIEVQEWSDPRGDGNQFTVRQNHRRTGDWQCSTTYRLIELAPTAAALMIELEERRQEENERVRQ